MQVVVGRRIPDFIPTGDDGRLLDLGIRALLRREIDIYRLQDWTLEIETGRHRAEVAARMTSGLGVPNRAADTP